MPPHGQASYPDHATDEHVALAERQPHYAHEAPPIKAGGFVERLPNPGWLLISARLSAKWVASTVVVLIDRRADRFRTRERTRLAAMVLARARVGARVQDRESGVSHSLPVSAPSARDGEGPPMTEYAIEGRPAYAFTLSDGSSFQVELHADFYSLMWSTSVSTANLLDCLTGLLPAENPDVVLWDDAIAELEHTDLAHARDRITNPSTKLEFLRLEYSDRTVTWEHSAVDEEMTRIGFLTETWDPDYVAELIDATATEPVKENSDEFVERAEYVTDCVPVGHLVLTEQ
jgi:hypothetical protein